MVYETRKILGDAKIKLTATAAGLKPTTLDIPTTAALSIQRLP